MCLVERLRVRSVVLVVGVEVMRPRKRMVCWLFQRCCYFPSSSWCLIALVSNRLSNSEGQGVERFVGRASFRLGVLLFVSLTWF